MYARNVGCVAVELSLMIRPWSCNKKVIVKQQLLVLYKYSRQTKAVTVVTTGISSFITGT